MTKSFQVIVPPNEIIKLSPGDFLASGGEGAIYKKNSRLFKIYHKKPNWELYQKIELLRKFRHDLVISPISIIQDEHQDLIGFTMNYINGDPLVKTFTNEWRTQENFTQEETVKLVERLREITVFAHSNKALIVDGNEMNYVVQRDKPFIIDVDSWQIGKFKATAIMNSVKDFTALDFSELTDWYSWAIITFQVFSGIHPFKGRHPDFKMGELEERVKAHVSVFNKETRIPQATRNFSIIPGGLREWYVSIFEGGKRSVPPIVTDGAKTDLTLNAKTYRTVQIDSNSALTFAKVKDFPSSIISVFPCGIVLLRDGSIYDWEGRFLAKSPTTKLQIVAAPITGYLMIYREAAMLTVKTIPALERVEFKLSCKEIIRKGNRLFVAHENSFTEISFKRMTSGEILGTVGNSWFIQEHSTLFFNGMGTMNALGSMFLILPAGDLGCAIIRAPELDGYTPIQGVFEGNLVSVIAIDQHGDFTKFEFSLSDDYSSYSIWFGKTDLSSELNIVVKNNIAISIVDDHELSVFSTKGGPTKVIHDKNISTDMKLYMLKGNVHFSHEKSLWRLSM